MKRLWFTLALVPALISCSPLLTLVVQNNTGAEVQICNLLRHDNPCVSAEAHEQARILLVADRAAPSWRLRISTAAVSKTYDFGDLWRLRSVPRCHTGCEVEVQLETDGLIYWVDVSRNPGVSAPVQPDGFPVRPGA